MASLSNQLFRVLRPDFFRVLAGPLAQLYVDVLDSLELEASQRSQGLDRAEVLALVERVIEQHQDWPDSGDGVMPAAMTTRDRARAVYDTLRTSGWLQEEERSDWQRLVLFDSNGTLLLQAMRRMVSPEAIFSDKLVNVCTTL
jgi:hypothetical protein